MEQTDHDILLILKQDMATVKREVEEVKERLEEKYTLKVEFSPIQRIVYGMVSISLLTIATALLALLFKR